MNRRNCLLIVSLLWTLLLLAFCLQGCAGKSREENYFENNYVYMWQKDGLKAATQRFCIQSEYYGLLIDGQTGKLLGAASADADEPFVEMDIDALHTANMTFELKDGDSYIASEWAVESCRIIDSGRYVQRLDNVSLNFAGIWGQTGRVEYAATKDHISIQYGLHSSVAGSFDARFSLSFDGCMATKLPEYNGILLLDVHGNGFAILPGGQDGVTLSIEESTVFAEYCGLSVEANTFGHFGVILIPVHGGDMEGVGKYQALQQVHITATSADGVNLPVLYNSSDGIFYVNTDSITVGPQYIAENRTALESVQFSLENRSNYDVEPTICFIKEQSNFSVTGMSPVIRDAVSGEPTGEQVQISKNWHTYSTVSGEFNYALPTDPNQIYSGQWFHGYLTLAAKGTECIKREYVCAYGNWGSVYAVSHAQLCLVGYTGYQLWEESALGSWGESITYDPDIGLNRSMVDDVRPFLCTAPTGGNQQYSWTGNVGGADFLKQSIVNQKIFYRTQAPCLTHVQYRGETSDGKIKTDITVNMGRTDDVVRTYYTIRYEFSEDYTQLYSPLCLFKVAADNYADNQYLYYAYGDAEGVTEKDLSTAVNAGQGTVKNATGEHFWYALYDSTNADENGDVMMIVREFNAELNGVTYDQPGYVFFGTYDNGIPQMSCELTLPEAVGDTVRKGSVVELVVEYVVVPADSHTYYGTSEYLLANRENMGSVDALYYQVTGAALNVTADVGQIVSSYPVYIQGEDGEIAASFTLEGGLGYVPITVGGLSTYQNWQLQYREGDEWKPVDQSVNGNDYWQTYYDATSCSYEITYNVNHTGKTEYRLIQR